MITSPDNATIIEVRKLAGRRWREKLGRFVAEGEDLVEAAIAARWPIVEVLRAGEDVEPNLLAKVSALGSGTRVIAICEQRWASEPAAPCVYLHGVSDPGNVGTVLRSALAFGAASVALGPGSADPFGPKAVRASMGAIFSVAVARVRDVDQLPRPRVALDAQATTPLHEVAPQAATLLVGAERDGLPADIAAEHRARIEIERAESLNVAMAATVALYERVRMPPA